MAIYWPEGLPFRIQYGARTKLGQGNKIVTDMEYGPKKVRRRFTNTPAYQTVTLHFTDSQLEQFLAFYYGEIAEGSFSFYANVISMASIELKRVTIQNDALEISHIDYNKHEIELIVEIYDPVGYASDEGALWIIGIYGPDIVTDLADTLDTLVNVVYPDIV